MVVQGKDEKWMSCREWAATDHMHRDVLGFSSVQYVPYYRYIPYMYTSIGIQCDYHCGWVINYVRQVNGRTLPTRSLLTSPPCHCNWEELHTPGDNPAKERYESGAGSPLCRPYNFGVSTTLNHL